MVVDQSYLTYFSSTNNFYETKELKSVWCCQYSIPVQFCLSIHVNRQPLYCVTDDLSCNYTNTDVQDKCTGNIILVSTNYFINNSLVANNFEVYGV